MKKIVLAEGNQDTRFILSKVLNNAGYKVESLDGPNIVEGKAQVPDVFILDQEIPTIDGFALSKFLRLQKETKQVPIIMLSSYPELQRKAKQIGITDFLTKQFQTSHLLQVIEKHVNRA